MGKMCMRRVLLVSMLALISAPAVAADPTFTKDEVQASYSLGRADAMREQLVSQPAAHSLMEKMKQAIPVPSGPAPAPPSAKKSK